MPMTDIEYVQWAHSNPKAVFILVHGLGAHGLRWKAFGEFFAARGISSYAIELKNFEHSRPPRARDEKFTNYYEKISCLYDIAAKENPGKNIFLIGESMGGLISFLYAAIHPGLLNGLVCISPAFENKYKPSLKDYFRIFVPFLYNPGKEHPLPFDPSMCTRDAIYRRMMVEDAREGHTLSSRLILEIFMAEAKARLVKDELDVPVLFLTSGEDKIVDSDGAKTIFERLKVKDKKLVDFPGMYHSLSIDIGREHVFEEILQWVEERTQI